MADVRTGTDKIKDEPRLCCFGRKEALKKNQWIGKGWGEVWFVKKHWNQLDEATIGQTWDNSGIKIMMVMDLTIE